MENAEMLTQIYKMINGITILVSILLPMALFTFIICIKNEIHRMNDEDEAETKKKQENFQLLCYYVKDDKCKYFTVGKKYEIKNGAIISNSGLSWTIPSFLTKEGTVWNIMDFKFVMINKED